MSSREWQLPTDRLVLRRLTTDDAGFVLRLLNEESFVRNIGDRGVRTHEQALAYLQSGPIASYAQHGHGLYLVTLTSVEVEIGLCGLVRREGLTHPDLGYALFPEFTGRGYAFEAARAVLRFARDVLGLSTIQAVVMPTNARSIRLLDQLGFVQIGTIALHDDRPADLLFERGSTC
jgi:ribosomal-protein-alanine N-acetyltransferase